jgi:hypothetical protein
MISAILIDLSLVAILEIQRSAVETALKRELEFFQQIHIASSLLAILFYFPTAYFGWKAYRAYLARVKPASNLHIQLGIITFALRTLGFITMFSLISRVTK